MSAVEFPCPDCGAKVRFDSSIAVTAVCAYCRSLVMRDDKGVKNLGKIGALLPDASPIQLGAFGTYDGDRFTVLGRLQMRYGQGVWNEWFLELSGAKQGWLGESQGLYALSFPRSPKDALPGYESLKIGQELSLESVSYEVRDKRRAAYASAEGQLPLEPSLGEVFPFVDLAGENAEFATLDYSEEPPLLFAGRYVDFAALSLENLRKFEGW